ncbi:acetolactate synthase small subunit [Marichromatium gracile]|uniref:Acetolactate synthase small subunit n=2 Tax=Marichromatium TaxID=85076 RepID=W0E1Y9_MARPU|nr:MULTISPECIES: acetolactate synthase small subunit [Marichromatium]MBO8084851.1 acetolactate synthase small subunit [Marichromatium sp.]AHF03224.1 acetolactate synthase [Marichromatium purpuratum 984]KXX63814.1 acetolactate synthase small subunit [Marichromatium gracile]MBK1709677.1 acetolactate synthase small subunit [Marichromatium gracile]MCF1184265.1 acetolactate synthase small subunit [Marichromatium gracile]
MRHIIAVLLENEAGALSRVAGLFSARGYNIESLTVAPTDDPTLSRMTLVTTGNDDIVEQIKKQLNKLVDTVKLLDLCEGPHIEREMMLVKVRAERRDREELKRLVDIFRAKIIDVTDTSYVIELTGATHKLDAFIDTVAEELIIEVVRSGPTGISRGEKGLTI